MKGNIINFGTHPAVVASQHENLDLFVDLIMNDPRHDTRVQIRRAQDAAQRRALNAQRTATRKHKFHLFGGKLK